ncbi:MAG: glycosyltransferase [Chloroflexota bacterium]|nr:glycosyltransferase [Chloroflexota bacterium]
MTSKSTPIGYITQQFPSLTTTFIYREVLALRKVGFNINTFAIWKPNVDKLSDESKHLVDSSFYVFPMSRTKFLMAHLYFLMTHPIKYISTFFFLLTRPGESIANKKRTFFHFFEAIYLALDAKRENIRHIHAHFTVNAATIAFIIARMLDISFSMTVHNNIFTDRVILKEKVKAAKFMIVISEFSRDFLLNLFPKENLDSKFHIVHCGVSPDDFQPAAHKTPNQRPLIFSVSQLAERKGYPVLLEACKILAERGCDFDCMIAGDGPERAILERLREEYQLQDRVQLLGIVFQEQLVDYLNQTDIFVLPCVTAANGDMDGVPVALMEAMAMELPVISTYVSGIPELIEDGQSGLLVEERDAVALADAIQRLLEDQKLRQDLGKGGRCKVSQEYNIFDNAAQLASLFEHHLQTK